jgi:hypothetical protein
MSHQNICTIYDVWQSVYRDGVSRRDAEERIKGRPMELETPLSLSIEIADGLTRRMRESFTATMPANIFVTRAGRPDSRFGLASWTARRKASAMPTVDAEEMLTSQARRWGRWRMSPEQVRGGSWMRERFVFSFSGAARDGHGRAATAGYFGSIYHDNESWSRWRLTTNRMMKLEEIINRALEKDRNLRYQHASDARVAVDEARHVQGA